LGALTLDRRAPTPYQPRRTGKSTESWGNVLESSYTYREDNLRLTRLHLSGTRRAAGLPVRYDPVGNIRC